MVTKHTKTVAMVLGTELPAFSIGYTAPQFPGDSGFTVLFDDAPEPEDIDGPEDPRSPRFAWTACSTTTRSSAVAWTSLANTASQTWTTTASGSWGISAGSSAARRDYADGQARSGATLTPAVPGLYGSVTNSPSVFSVVGMHSFPLPMGSTRTSTGHR